MLIASATFLLIPEYDIPIHDVNDIMLSVVLANLLRYNLIRVGGYLGQLYELTFWRDPVSVRSQILRETTIAFIFFALLQLRYLCCFSIIFSFFADLMLVIHNVIFFCFAGGREIQTREPKIISLS